MKNLNTFHRQILVDKLRALIDEKENLRSVRRRFHKDMLEANGNEQRIEATQASIDLNELQVEFVQNQIERIEEIIIDGQI